MAAKHITAISLSLNNNGVYTNVCGEYCGYSAIISPGSVLLYAVWRQHRAASIEKRRQQ